MILCMPNGRGAHAKHLTDPLGLLDQLERMPTPWTGPAALTNKVMTIMI